MKSNYFKAAKALTKAAQLISRWNWAYYIGGQETANRLDAQQLKNRATLIKTEQGQNKLVLQDQQIEINKLKILKERRELGLDAPEFDPTGYTDVNPEFTNRNK